jgi:hypothetical protein
LICAHCWATTGVLLLGKIGPWRFLGGPVPLLKFQHPLLELGVEQVFLPPQIIGANEEKDCPLAFARGTVKFGNLVDIKDEKNIVVRYQSSHEKNTHTMHTLLTS